MSLHLTIQNIDHKLFNIQSSALNRCTLQYSQKVSFHSETGPLFSNFFSINAGDFVCTTVSPYFGF